MSSNLDLLFGLLALQNGLIDQGQLVAAFQAWTRDKSKSLAEHLIQRGDLDDQQRSVIDAMVGLHLAKHGGDVEKSLASVPVGQSTRESLAGLGDPEIEGRLRSLGSGTTEPDDPFPTIPVEVGTTTSGGLRFRFLRPHQRGGLGKVSVAMDEELHREVALKEILDCHADKQHFRQRFLLEAEITGGLEHPGIVPVYGMGTYGDGQPYYAMRFIRGDNLSDAIKRFHADEALKRDVARKSLELRKLLRRFLDVCNALEYAHARGVLHRDIKPGNIIVGKYGETLVVDWGLAKATGRSEPAAQERPLLPASASGAAETLPGGAIGTPAYMSPEQARGDLDSLGPRSDVYSLGVTLYNLLTGKLPFEGRDGGAVLGRVVSGELSPPRLLDPFIDRPLEAITLKAMATRPEDRYPSCKTLADDLDRWLADDRVEAYPEPWTRSLTRWLTRHRTGVTAAAAAVLVGVAGLGGIAAVQTRARADLARKNGELTKTNVALEAQRKRATERELQAIDAVRLFGAVVIENPELRNNSSLAPLRKKLLEEQLEFFRSLRESLQADGNTSPDALEQLAFAAFLLAGLTEEIGNPTDVLQAYTEYRTIVERLVKEHPDDNQAASTLAHTHGKIGNLLREAKRMAEAMQSLEASRGIWDRLTREHPDDSEYASWLGTSLNSLAMLDIDTGHPDRASELLRQAIEWQKKALAINPRGSYREDLEVHYQNLHRVARETSDSKLEAEAELRLAEVRASYLHDFDSEAEERLKAIARGATPRNMEERLSIALRAYGTRQFALAARLWGQAVEADPVPTTGRLVGHKYNAACAAALAASGEGSDSPTDEGEKRQLTRRAIGWLERDLAEWIQWFKGANEGRRQQLAATMAHWQEDPDLEWLRDPMTIARLPGVERMKAEKIWKDVASLKARAEGAGGEAKAPTELPEQVFGP